MDFTRESPIVVRSFHYDMNEKLAVKSEVNVAMRKAALKQDDGSMDAGTDGGYYEVAVVFEVSPEPGEFTVSGLISQVVKIAGYHGEGKDLAKSDYKLMSRPLVEYIETLTYEVTQVAMDKPVNLNFKPNF
ncbi:MAG: DUF1149 family protein [Lactobacillus sp.]